MSIQHLGTLTVSTLYDPFPFFFFINHRTVVTVDDSLASVHAAGETSKHTALSNHSVDDDVDSTVCRLPARYLHEVNDNDVDTGGRQRREGRSTKYDMKEGGRGPADSLLSTSGEVVDVGEQRVGQ